MNMEIFGFILFPTFSVIAIGSFMGGWLNLVSYVHEGKEVK